MTKLITDISNIFGFEESLHSSIQPTFQDLKNHFGENTFQKGAEYFFGNFLRVDDRYFDGMVLHGKCNGTANEPYTEWIQFQQSGSLLDANCTCPIGSKGDCKHVAALLLSVVKEDPSKLKHMHKKGNSANFPPPQDMTNSSFPSTFPKRIGVSKPINGVSPASKPPPLQMTIPKNIAQMSNTEFPNKTSSKQTSKQSKMKTNTKYSPLISKEKSNLMNNNQQNNNQQKNNQQNNNQQNNNQQKKNHENKVQTPIKTNVNYQTNMKMENDRQLLKKTKTEKSPSSLTILDYDSDCDDPEELTQMKEKLQYQKLIIKQQKSKIQTLKFELDQERQYHAQTITGYQKMFSTFTSKANDLVQFSEAVFSKLPRNPFHPDEVDDPMNIEDTKQNLINNHIDQHNQKNQKNLDSIHQNQKSLNGKSNPTTPNRNQNQKPKAQTNENTSLKKIPTSPQKSESSSPIRNPPASSTKFNLSSSSTKFNLSSSPQKSNLSSSPQKSGPSSPQKINSPNLLSQNSPSSSPTKLSQRSSQSPIGASQSKISTQSQIKNLQPKCLFGRSSDEKDLKNSNIKISSTFESPNLDNPTLSPNNSQYQKYTECDDVFVSQSQSKALNTIFDEKNHNGSLNNQQNSDSLSLSQLFSESENQSDDKN